MNNEDGEKRLVHALVIDLSQTNKKFAKEVLRAIEKEVKRNE